MQQVSDGVRKLGRGGLIFAGICSDKLVFWDHNCESSFDFLAEFGNGRFIGMGYYSGI